MIIAAVRDDAYDIVLTLHILAAIVGFGGVTLNGIYGQQAGARKGREGLAISEANFLVSTVAEYFIYAVFVLGIVLVLLSDDVYGFGEGWVWMSMLLFVAAIGVSHGGVRPRVKRMIAIQRELVDMGPPPAGATTGGPPPQVVQLETLGKQVGMLSTFLHLALVVILVLMVFKP